MSDQWLYRHGHVLRPAHLLLCRCYARRHLLLCRWKVPTRPFGRRNQARASSGGTVFSIPSTAVIARTVKFLRAIEASVSRVYDFSACRMREADPERVDDGPGGACERARHLNNWPTWWEASEGVSQIAASPAGVIVRIATVACKCLTVTPCRPTEGQIGASHFTALATAVVGGYNAAVLWDRASRRPRAPCPHMRIDGHGSAPPRTELLACSQTVLSWAAQDSESVWWNARRVFAATVAKMARLCLRRSQRTQPVQTC